MQKSSRQDFEKNRKILKEKDKQSVYNKIIFRYKSWGKYDVRF